jgi:hypothetical protein
MRSVAGLAAGLTLWLAGLPSVPPVAGADLPRQCAGYTIRLSEAEARQAGRSTRLDVLRGRTVVGTVSAWQIPDAQCTDVTGDDRPDLIVELFSGGAHCCATIQVFQLRPAFRRILDFAAGNAGGFSVERDRTGRPALLLDDGGLAYYGDLRIASEPAVTSWLTAQRDGVMKWRGRRAGSLTP